MNVPIYTRGGKNGKGDSLTHLLEMVGYVCTSEIDEENLRVIPIGHSFEDNMHTFCCMKGYHETDQ